MGFMVKEEAIHSASRTKECDPRRAELGMGSANSDPGLLGRTGKVGHTEKLRFWDSSPRQPGVL